MLLNITYPLSPLRPSVHTSLVADLFGLTEDVGPHVVAHDLDLQVEPGLLIAFTGPSGSGKSSLLRAVSDQLRSEGSRIIGLDETELPNVAAIDGLGLPFERATALLSSCGLAEPRLMLRRPSELSDGERWRFRLASALAKEPDWIAIDEFTAALDRTLAKIIALSVRRQCERTEIGFLIATCHEDVVKDLRPDLHVRCDHDGLIEVRTFAAPATHQTRLTSHPTPCSVSQTTSKSRPARHATGRTSLGGITDRTASAACDS